MSRGAWGLLSVPLRIVRALLRHGPLEVARFWLDVVRRRGVEGALNYALRKDRPPATLLESEPSAARAPPPLRPSLAEWRSWLRETTPLAHGDVFADAVTPIRLHVVCSDGEGMAATRASVTQLEASALLAPATIGDAGMPPPVDPDAWIVFLQPGDRLTPDAATRLARVSRAGVAEVITFDMWCETDGRVEPFLLPGANATLAGEANYTFGRMAIRRGVLPPALSGLSAPSWVRRNAKRLSSPEADGRFRHVGRPIVALGEPPSALIERERARLIRSARRAAPPVAPERVSVVICTQNKGWLTTQLVHGLLAKPALAQIVLVANNTTSPHALEALNRLSHEDRVTVIRRDEPFNFSRLCNEGAALAGRGDRLLFLNDDIVPASHDWLERMVARVDRPWVGAAGALLLYPDERVQHAGMYLGYRGAAGHTRRFANLGEDYLFTTSAARDVSAVTGAAMMVRRDVFDAVAGFDEMLPTFLQDVDLCLRIAAGGYRIVLEPAAVLFHMESATLRDTVASAAMQTRRWAERQWFERRWGGFSDPFHPVSLSVEDEGLATLSEPLTGEHRPD